MKVNFVQVDKAVFRYWWCWWSDWVDICVFDYACTGYLVQMSVNRFNKKKFRAVGFTGYKYVDCSCEHVMSDR